MELPSSAMDVPVSKSPISESASNIMLSIQPEYDGIRRDHTHSLTEKVNRGRAGKKQGAWVRMMLGAWLRGMSERATVLLSLLPMELVLRM